MNSYIWVDGPRITVKRIVHLSGEKNTILDRVNSSMGWVCRWNSDKTTIITVIPRLLVGQGKYMSGFEVRPPAKVS